MTLRLSDSKDTYDDIEKAIAAGAEDINGYGIDFIGNIDGEDMYQFDEDGINLTKSELIDTVFAHLIYLDVMLENQYLLKRGFFSMDNDIRTAIDNRDYVTPFSVWLRTVIKPIAQDYKYMQ